MQTCVAQIRLRKYPSQRTKRVAPKSKPLIRSDPSPLDWQPGPWSNLLKVNYWISVPLIHRLGGKSWPDRQCYWSSRGAVHGAELLPLHSATDVREASHEPRQSPLIWQSLSEEKPTSNCVCKTRWLELRCWCHMDGSIRAATNWLTYHLIYKVSENNKSHHDFTELKLIYECIYMYDKTTCTYMHINVQIFTFDKLELVHFCQFCFKNDLKD